MIDEDGDGAHEELTAVCLSLRFEETFSVVRRRKDRMLRAFFFSFPFFVWYLSLPWVPFSVGPVGFGMCGTYVCFRFELFAGVFICLSEFRRLVSSDADGRAIDEMR